VPDPAACELYLRFVGTLSRVGRAARGPGQFVGPQSGGVREWIESTGAELLYLPPYSPDFNPIEKAWAKLKQLLPAAKARTTEVSDAAVAEVLKTITADNAAAWFRHWGYSLQQS